MIILRRFYTYKDNFPLMSANRLAPPFDVDMLDGLMRDLILQLSDIAALPPYSYITRHTNDNIPPDHLAPFLATFRGFVSALGQNQPYNIPTVWLVGHFQDHDSVAQVRQQLDQKDLKYFDRGEEYDSFDQFNEAYWEDRSDAEPFVKFIHQTTMIGLDLLRTDEYKQRLGQLERLEWIQYANVEDMKSDLRDMEFYLNETSQYYREQIAGNTSECKGFWLNFTKLKLTYTATRVSCGSWPHFLFNMCGVSSPARNRPLEVNTAELSEDWW
jgi:hypothetical protein